MPEPDYKALYEKEKRRANREARRANQEARRANQETRRANRATQVTQKTTLQEYLKACQKYVLSKIVLNTTGYLTTRVPSTNPSKKHCPRLIRPWHDFDETQDTINECIDRIIPQDLRLFEHVAFLELHGQRVQNRHVHREADLTFVHNNAIEDPVRIIINEMKDLQPEREGVFLHSGVHFQTTAQNLRNTAGNTETRRDKRLLTDQVCVLRGHQGQEDSVAYIIEYKAPCRLHTMHLEKGLKPMSILDDVVNKPTTPNFEPEKFQHSAELLTAAALTQTYHYMLEAGLEYGCIANGDALLFLKIDWTEPTVLLYHLAQPSREVELNDDPTYSNAVCQLLAFTVLALQSQQKENKERLAAIRRGDVSGSGSGSGSGRGRGDDNAEQHGRPRPPFGSVTALTFARRQPRPYCTPLCLLSLVHGRALDSKCPNATLHRGDQQKTSGKKKASSPEKHPVSYTQWTSLLREQLSEGLDDGVVVLGKEGSCGALLQITLLQYGYTFVAKGGAKYAIPLLQHEEAVYERLQPLQGRYIPVCMGSVDLRRLDQIYFYKIGIRLVYFLFMSYGGTAFQMCPDPVAKDGLVTRLKSVVDEMHSLGVVHGDIRLPNVLLSPTGGLTVIDFDQALLLPSTDLEDEALDDASLNKRKRKPRYVGGDDGKDAAAKAKQSAVARLGRNRDRSNADSIFAMDLGRIIGWPNMS
ncbi:metalloprotease-like protein [Ophiostoma piceae UAMH 11346]|uniref:Metalloprotease-like protein n=1 Tax=Ophiostoma piceae (strain UAMH 11346) TaxID=1262450 RepID=S3CUR3_OPHP1|nr:metalloprotease-like protein [Ophiostoma piceae UAMH 11346]